MIASITLNSINTHLRPGEFELLPRCAHRSHQMRPHHSYALLSPSLTANPCLQQPSVTNITINMAQTRLPDASMPLPSKTGWDWGITSNYIRIPQPQMGFYWKMPADATCIFSITDQVREKRSFRRGAIPSRSSNAWMDDDIRSRAAALRSQYGDKTKTIVRPKVWEDLYQYFDAVDLWNMGAWNLWRVLHFLCDENEGPPPQSRLDAAAIEEIEQWAYDWCTHEQNRIRLGWWDQRSDILHVLSPANLQDLDGYGPEVLTVLRGALMYWHRMYKNPAQQRYGHAASGERIGNQDPLPAETQDGTYLTIQLLNPQFSDQIH